MDLFLRQQIESGSYRIDADRVAAAMITRIARLHPSAVLVAPEPSNGEAVGSEQTKARAPFHEA